MVDRTDTDDTPTASPPSPSPPTPSPPALPPAPRPPPPPPPRAPPAPAPEPRARADLHVLAAQGRQDAIEALLRQFRPVIVRYVRARLTPTGHQDEDDVAQEVCLALLSALPSYRDMGRPFAAFVFAIGAHKVADAVRGAARSPLPVPVLPDVPDRCLGPEETAVASLEASQARILLASLPAGQR